MPDTQSEGNKPVTSQTEAPHIPCDAELAEIRARVTGTCSCCGFDKHDFETADVLTLMNEVNRLRNERAKLGNKAVKRLAKQMADQSRIKALNIRNGVAELEMDEARELCAAYVGAARAMLTGAENYLETRVDFEVKVAESPERYVLTVQRAGKLTPHEARMKAEAKLDELQGELGVINAEWGVRWPGHNATEKMGEAEARTVVRNDLAATLRRRLVGEWQDYRSEQP